MNLSATFKVWEPARRTDAELLETHIFCAEVEKLVGLKSPPFWRRRRDIAFQARVVLAEVVERRKRVASAFLFGSPPVGEEWPTIAKAGESSARLGCKVETLVSFGRDDARDALIVSVLNRAAELFACVRLAIPNGVEVEEMPAEVVATLEAGGWRRDDVDRRKLTLSTAVCQRCRISAACLRLHYRPEPIPICAACYERLTGYDVTKHPEVD